MADRTGISWTDATWNPVVGCTRVSAGCDNCYAIAQSHRIAAQLAGNPKVEESAYLPDLTELIPVVPDPADPGRSIDPAIGSKRDWTGVVRINERVLHQPQGWTRPRRVFVNSMSDLFHPGLSEFDIAQVWSVMARSPQHQFQVLTKRPGRAAEMMAIDRGAMFPWYVGGNDVWPLPNVWLGTSIESDKYAWRVDKLRETHAAVRFLSLEPLLGPLPHLDLSGIDWVIVGGESGPNARPMDPGWARDVREQCELNECETCAGEGLAVGEGEPCHSDCGGTCIDWGRCDYPCQSCEGSGLRPIPFFFKQWGNWRPVVGGSVREKSKNWAGHDLLDGKEWKQFPR